MLQMVKNYKLSNGQTIENYLQKRFGSFKNYWEATKNTVEFIVFIPGLSRPTIFRWSIEGNGFYAVNGHAISLTPELDKKMLEIEKRKREIPDDKKAVYYFMKTEWEKLEREDGQYIIEKHDPIVLDKASKAFGISKEQAASIYDEFEKTIYGLT